MVQSTFKKVRGIFLDLICILYIAISHLYEYQSNALGTFGIISAKKYTCDLTRKNHLYRYIMIHTCPASIRITSIRLKMMTTAPDSIFSVINPSLVALTGISTQFSPSFWLKNNPRLDVTSSASLSTSRYEHSRPTNVKRSSTHLPHSMNSEHWKV